MHAQRRAATRGRVGAVLAALAASLAMAFTAAPALAVDQNFTFDDLPANTVVSNQYAGRGLTFGPSVAGQRQGTASLPTVINVGTSRAASGDRVGRVSRACFSPQCVGTAETWASFSTGQARVSLSVGAFGTASNTITATAFNASGAQVAQASATAPGGVFRTRLSLATTTAAIRFVRVRGSTVGTFGIDSLFASTSPLTGADFAISVPFGTHVVPQGGFVDVPVTLTRRNSSESITISATGLPPGVGVTPVVHTLASPSTVTSSHSLNLRLSGGATAAPVTDRDITVTATPATTAAGIGQRTQVIRIRLLVLFDVHASGIDLTQGIQRRDSSVRLSSTALRYGGVPLQYNGRTIVRVYGNTIRGGQGVSGTVARLFGFRQDGTALPGSPLFPDGGSRTLLPGSPGVVSDGERLSPTSAWTFTLPLSWTGFGRPSASNPFTQADFLTTLRAVVTPPNQSVAFRECDGCSPNDTLTLSQVNYEPTCCVGVSTVLFTATGGSAPRPIETILREGVNISPLELIVPPYQTTIDITDALERNEENRLVLNRAKTNAPLEASRQRDGGDIAIGVIPTEYSDGYGGYPLAVFDDRPDRPYTSSAHELGHALGRPNASPSCEGDGEAWPPDETGLIQGIALDRTVASPYRVFATPTNLDVRPAVLPTTEGGGDPNAFYDLMSYCARDSNAWISVKGWTDTIRMWPRGGFVAQERSPLSPRAHQAGGSLVVNASAEPTGAVTITDVLPLVPKPDDGLEATPYAAVVKDAGGAVLAQAPMGGRTPIAERPPAPPTFLTATLSVDPNAARSVEILRDGAVVASRTRSANAPRGAFTRPRANRLVGRSQELDIRWTASDADGDPLDVTLEWSPRGGRPGTWRTVFIGPNGGRVGLPSDYFGGSARAFLRLRINDGFNETVVLSPAFRTIHRAPTVTITSPRGGARVRRGAGLLLTANGFDEARRPLPASALRWFDGRRQIARGDGILVRGLPVGPRTIRLVATDSAGRRATARVKVRVLAVAPVVTTLRFPRRVAVGARSVRLRVATALPARLVVRGGARRVSADVGPRVSRVQVPLASRPGFVSLSLAFRADARTTTRTVQIDR